jgi:hypothetical protein
MGIWIDLAGIFSMEKIEGSGRRLSLAVTVGERRGGRRQGSEVGRRREEREGLCSEEEDFLAEVVVLSEGEAWKVEEGDGEDSGSNRPQRAVDRLMTSSRGMLMEVSWGSTKVRFLDLILLVAVTERERRKVLCRTLRNQKMTRWLWVWRLLRKFLRGSRGRMGDC